MANQKQTPYFLGTILFLLVVAFVATWYSRLLATTWCIGILAGIGAWKYKLAVRMSGQRQTVITASCAFTLLLIFSLLTHTALNVFVENLGLLAVAVLPSFQLLSHVVHQQQPFARQVTNLLTLKLTLVGIGIVAQTFFHIPPAISMLELVLLDTLLAIIPLPAGVKEHHPVALNAFGATLAYGAFVLFFISQGVRPANLDASSHLYFAGTTLSFLVLLLSVISQSLPFSRSPRTLRSVAIMLTAVMLLAYIPWLQTVLHTGPLAFTDWLLAIAATLAYVLAHGLHRHSKRHSRYALFRDHSHETLREHPKLAA